MDKAGQFTNGYMYLGNNPVMGIDPDGNLFFVPFLVGAAYGALYSAATYTALAPITGAEWTWGGLGDAMAFGALSGGIGATFSQIGGKLANKLSYKLVSGAATNASTSAVLGRKITAAGIAGGMAGSAVSHAAVGNFKVASRNRWGNIGAELGHSSVSGAISGVSGGMVTNALSGRNVFENMSENFRYGAAGGLASGVANIAIMGGATRPPEDIERALEAEASRLGITESPLYRSGGLYGLGAKLGLLRAGFAGFGRNLIVNETDMPIYNEELWVHETSHYWQQRGGWANTVGILAGEAFTHNPYDRLGTLEWQAVMVTQFMGYGRHHYPRRY